MYVSLNDVIPKYNLLCYRNTTPALGYDFVINLSHPHVVSCCHIKTPYPYNYSPSRQNLVCNPTFPTYPLFPPKPDRYCSSGSISKRPQEKGLAFCVAERAQPT